MGGYDTLPLWAAGHIVTDIEAQQLFALLNGTGVNGGLLDEQAFYKPALTTYAASSTTLQNDPDLVTPNLVVSAVYTVEVVLFYATVAAALIKVGFTFPTGSSWTWQSISLDAGVTAADAGIINRRTLGSGTVVMGCNAGAIMDARISGTLTMSTTAGKLQLQAAQNVSNATAPSIGVRSSMIVKRIT